MQNSGANESVLCDKNQLSLESIQQIIRSSQKRHFKDEIKTLERSECFPKSNSIYKLDQYIDDNRLRVGGRLLSPNY